MGEAGQLSIADLANLAFAIGILAAGILSVAYIFVGGISFILSGGQEDKIRQAINTIRYAVIGLIVTIGSIFIIQVVGYIFNFDLISILSWDRITELMGGLVDRIMNSGGSSQGPSLPTGGTGTLR